jgi:outer membrane protein TolC
LCSALEAKRSVFHLQTRQLSATVGLIKALGGGWNVAQLTASNPIETKEKSA